ncbi:family 1 glycosylhydrolase [Sphaerisporangium sp. NPDC005289]|uniref:family 1 glycosylhydrolase n=1 Tax=Sphaerisporangium sp. NPDC005289 TaxID=3155247 RepID=UPI0033B01A12
MPNLSAFPPEFLWGASSAGHQIEGGNLASDFWEMEHASGTVFAEPSGDACDGYHRWREDVGLLAGIGLNAYRFSLEWSRVEPEEGRFSRAAIDHYRRVVEGCHERGVTPVVTLQHITVPRWFRRSGCWTGPQAAARFALYTRELIGPHGPLPVPEGAETTQIGWEYYPEAVGGAVRHAATVTGGIPILRDRQKRPPSRAVTSRDPPDHPGAGAGRIRPCLLSPRTTVSMSPSRFTAMDLR